MKQYVVIRNSSGDEWMIGVYEDYEKAYGAILLEAFHSLDTLNIDLEPNEKACVMSMSSRPDSFGGYYMEIKVNYSATSNNLEITDYYRVFFNKEVLEDR